MRTNVKFATSERTHEGALSTKILTPAQELRRTVMACMLFEDSFYESGVSATDRMKELIKKCSFEEVAEIAITAREKMKLRHVPLFLTRELLRNYNGRKVGDLIARVIQRPDECGELLALYWKDNKAQPLTAQLKIGLARALKKFNEYQLAKWNNDGDVKLRDVLFLSHAKPGNDEQAALFKKLAANELVTPDTWEVALSGGADKKEAFERLMTEKKLGGMALLRNLRLMLECGVSEDTIRNSLGSMNTERILPFRFISAARHAPRLESAIEQAMFKCTDQMSKLTGKTVLIIDVSGSMGSGNISAKSDLSRLDGAYALAILARELCENVQVYCTAGSDGTRIHKTELVPARRGFSLADACNEKYQTLGGGGIFLKQVMDYVYDLEKTADRVIVLTDEQDCDVKCNPSGANAFGKRNYIINVANYKNGIAYEKFTHISGWSEAIIDFINENEKENNAN